MEPVGPAVHVAIPSAADVTALAAVAARTFPLACPPSASADDVAAFVDTELSAERFAAYLDDPNRTVMAAYEDSRMIGYCLLIRGVSDDPDVQRAVFIRPSVELSKMYVLPDNHGSGVAAALLQAAIDRAKVAAAESIWLGVNQENRRAQRFYAKHGFTVKGTKTFRLGRSTEHDYVMVRPA